MQSVLRMYNLIPKKNGAAMSGTDFGGSRGDQNHENDYISRFETSLNLTCWVYFSAGARPRGLILVTVPRIIAGDLHLDRQKRFTQGIILY